MALHLENAQTNELLYVGFNQDSACFAVGTDQGFRIYNCEPFKETFRRDFSGGGIGMVEMLFRCNILALVGGGRMPRYPKNKVMIWDDHQNRCIGELMFRTNVQAVKLRRDRVVVALKNKVYVYNFADLSLLDHIETVENPKGIVAICPATACNVLACPGLQRGHVRVELYDHKKTAIIAAHEAALACIALNNSGTRLATASEKGTLIRVYDTLTGELLQELRRGADKAEILCLCFNADSSMLACSSDKGTVHIFKLRDAVRVAPQSTALAPPPPAASAAAGAGASAGSAAAPSSGAAGAVGSRGGASSGPGGVAASGAAAAAGAEGASAGKGSEEAVAGGLRTGGAAAGAGAGAEASEGKSGGKDSKEKGGEGGKDRDKEKGGEGSKDKKEDKKEEGGSGGGGFSFMKGILPKYFTSEWSFAQFRVPDTRSMVAFGQEPNTVIIVGADGSFFKANYEKGGEAVRVAYSQFVKSSMYADGYSA